MNRISTHFRICNLCEAACGLRIEVEDGGVTSIRGDRDDPFSRGHICPKAIALKDIQEDSDRLKMPVRRAGNGEWEEIGWQEALDEAAERMASVQKKYGRDALAIYRGNPNSHNYGSLLFAPPLLRSLRSKNTYSATSVDQLPHHLAAMLMFGHQLLLPVPDIDRTRFMLILGANPVVSNGSMMTAPGFKDRLQALKQRGGTIVVVDPRRTETAEIAQRHLFIRPGTDAFLLASLLHVLFAEGLVDLGRLQGLCSSFSGLGEIFEDMTPERVAPITAVDAGSIRELALEFAAAESAVCYGRMGVSTQGFGGLCLWMINLLNIVTGNFDRVGGAMFPEPAIDLLSSVGRGRLGRWSSRVRDLPEFGGELPVSTLAEEILSEGDGQVRALLTIAGNPVLSTPNGRQLDAALGQLESMVAIDFYINETTRHANLILPPTPALERDHYDLVFNILAVRNVARYSKPVFKAAKDALHEWQILSELHRRLDRGGFGAQLRRTFLSRLGPRRLVDLGLRRGPYGSLLPGRGLSLARLEEAVHGMDLGPLQPCIERRLQTTNRKIDLAPTPYVQDLERLRQELEPNEVVSDRGMTLIGRRHLRSNNSWMHNYGRLMGGKDRCTLLMHSEDAGRRGLESGQLVEVSSRVGRVTVALEVTDEMMPGVVSLPHGWGHNLEGVHLATAQQHPGVNINDLTDELRVDPLTGNAAFSGVPVWVSDLSTNCFEKTRQTSG
ncbi:MAG: molybdopterin oxidoreductase family protein [Acidobacteria bacterium]|nr:MAG: molybdopterin oxidoreductase family protein [Acidobacteriota bacterium]